MRPKDLGPAQAHDIDHALSKSGYTLSTKSMRATATRRVLRWLWQEHGSPKLDQHIRRYTGVRPRNTTAAPEEIDTILEAALPHMRLWRLLCSDLAIRSGTAAHLEPADYQPQARELRFTTKGQAKLTLPVTAEIKELLDKGDMRLPVPFVRQLWSKAPGKNGQVPDPKEIKPGGLRCALRQLLKRAGITRRLTPHDLRRTTAVAMYRQTGDVRDVQALLGHRSLQSTIWYSTTT